jgi:hypothetical protein
VEAVVSLKPPPVEAGGQQGQALEQEADVKAPAATVAASAEHTAAAAAPAAAAAAAAVGGATDEEQEQEQEDEEALPDVDMPTQIPPGMGQRYGAAEEEEVEVGGEGKPGSRPPSANAGEATQAVPLEVEGAEAPIELEGEG